MTDQHCAHAATLTGTEKIAYMREHDITGEQVWWYTQEHKDTGSTRAKKKRERTRALASQQGCCALCGEPAKRFCLDRTGKVVCNSCNLFLTQYRKLRAEGVECSDVEAFIE